MLLTRLFRRYAAAHVETIQTPDGGEYLISFDAMGVLPLVAVEAGEPASPVAWVSVPPRLPVDFEQPSQLDPVVPAHLAVLSMTVSTVARAR